MNHGVIRDFIKKLRKNSSALHILGDGRQEKNYIYIDDCLDGMQLGFNNLNSHCEIYNLGNESTTTVDRIAEIVCDEMHLTNAELIHTGTRGGWLGDAPYIFFNISKIKKLGFKLRYTSDEAVINTVHQSIKEKYHYAIH